MNIPAVLVDKVREGAVVLFLGSGASAGAVSPGGDQMPDGAKLSALLSDKFLGGEEAAKPLAVVSELAISETDLLTVQGFLRDFFLKFQPADFHYLISTFRWAGIVTTNYDLVIDRAYGKKPAQELVPFYKNSDRVDSKLRSPNALPLIKLHGCISHWNDLDIPLILTIDQYVTHKRNRDKLFERFKHYASEYTVVFVGSSLEDPDLRQLLLDLSGEDVSRPRYYVVTPSPSDKQARFWETKKITALTGTLKDFLQGIDVALDKTLRVVGGSVQEHPIEKRFVKAKSKLSQETLSFLSSDAVYIRPDLADAVAHPRDFYRGYFHGWSAIQQQLDIPRHLTDSLLSDVILIDDVDRPTGADFYAVMGHAGSGKSVILKRLAWDAANEFGKLCLFVKSTNRISYDQIAELAELVGERIFLFVDRASDHVGDLISLLRNARAKSTRLTVVVAERTNEWNMDCALLSQYVSDTFDVRYLSAKEIEQLLDRLAQYKCLGTLEGASREAQTKAFAETAGRQLIVALHEATSGLPFRDIVINEYNNIQPENARLIYLTICTLNRLDVQVRAGLVKRLHGVSFETFKEKFFLPLESVVHVEPYLPARDMAYRARHPWVAEIVFERALPNAHERLDLYLRLLSELDIGYEVDRRAYRELIKARALIDIFSDPLMVRAIYDKAKVVGDSDGYFHQQRAIYEMRRVDGSYETAYEELQIAKKLAPYDKSVLHTLADLEFKRAQAAKKPIEKERHLKSAQELASSLTGRDADSSHGYHTLCRIALEKLEAQLSEDPDNNEAVTRLIRNVEQQLQEGLQRFPDDPYLLDAESILAITLKNDARAVAALEKAFKVNQMSPFVAKGLARLYEARGEVDKAKKVLETCVDGLPGDKAINASLGRLITKYFPTEGAKAESYWRRAFTEWDSNYNSQFWYARQLYVNGKYQPARDTFRRLRGVPVAPGVKSEIQGQMVSLVDGSPLRFRGSVQRLEATYAWLSREDEVGWVFLHRSHVAPEQWDSLLPNMLVTYQMGFNYSGPAAFALELI